MADLGFVYKKLPDLLILQRRKGNAKASGSKKITLLVV